MFLDLDDHDHDEDLPKPTPSDLLTGFHETRWDTEVLALRSVHDVQVPVWGVLSQLSSSECLKLLKYELDDWANKNSPSNDTILLNYLVTDYIYCGLSSPVFHVEFNRTLQSNQSKYKLLNNLISIWACLFKNCETTSSNVAFIKQLIVSLDRLVVKIFKLLPEYITTWKWEIVTTKIKRNIEVYEQNVLNSKIVLTSRNNIIQPNNSLQHKAMCVQNTVSKQSINSKLNTSIETFMDQNNKIKTQNTTVIHSRQQQKFEQSTDHHQSKKLKLITNDEENAKPDPVSGQLSEPKLNVFQLMMLNAKKRKANAK